MISRNRTRSDRSERYRTTPASHSNAVIKRLLNHNIYPRDIYRHRKSLRPAFDEFITTKPNKPYTTHATRAAKSLEIQSGEVNPDERREESGRAGGEEARRALNHGDIACSGDNRFPFGPTSGRRPARRLALRGKCEQTSGDCRRLPTSPERDVTVGRPAANNKSNLP